MITFLVSSIAVLIPAWLIAEKIMSKQILNALLLYFILVLLQITIIELILGVCQNLNKIGMLLLSVIECLVLLFFLYVTAQKKKKTNDNLIALDNFNQKTNSKIKQLNQIGIATIFSLFILIIVLYKSLFIDLLIQGFLVHPLSWDVVTYHLPNAVDYINFGNLWTLQGVFSEYPGGNELINIWTLLPFRTDIFLGFNGIYIALGFGLVSTILLCNILPINSAFLTGSFSLLLWSICLSIPDFQNMLFDFGRNDLILAFWQLVSLWCLQQSVSNLQTRKLWLIFMGLSLGMGVGIKPNGIYYLLGFVGILLSPYYAKISPDKSLKTRLFELISHVLLPTFLIGGFWYIRNLLKIGALFKSGSINPLLNKTIFVDLLNPDFYHQGLAVYLFFASVLTTSICLLLWLGNFCKDSLAFRLYTSFNLIAIIALIFTPYSSGYPTGDQWFFKVQLRYGIALLPTTVILILFLLNQFLISICSRSNHIMKILNTLDRSIHTIYKPKSSFFFISLINLILAIVITAQINVYKPPIGLPGFNDVLFLGNVPPSNIYKWIQANLSRTTIYNVGLRPYGLYGFPFSNQVIYQGDSNGWTYPKALEIIRKFSPNYLVISRDPFSAKFPEDIQLLINNENKFQMIYHDHLALVFRIKS